MQKRERKSRKQKINKKLFAGNIVLCLCFIFLIFFYIVHISDTSKQGFEISRLEQKIVRYREDIARLDEKLKKAKTTEYIMAEAKRMNMVSIDKYDFLSPASSGVALNK